MKTYKADKAARACALAFVAWLMAGGGLSCGTALADSIARAGDPQLPLQIAPEGVLVSDQPFLLVDAEGPRRGKVGDGADIRFIYYTRTPTFRAAAVRVVQDRNAQAGARFDATKFASQRLTGNPLDWQRVGLKFSQDPVPVQPLELTPLQLSEALKDGADVQIVDLRPPTTAVSPFVGEALRLLPHEVEAELPKLSKQRWLVFVDGGDGIGGAIAERLFRQGYLLATSLKGGYPAWTAATDR